MNDLWVASIINELYINKIIIKSEKPCENIDDEETVTYHVFENVWYMFD